MSTPNFSKSRLSHKELWGLVRDEDSTTLLGQDAGDVAMQRGGSQGDQPSWLQIDDPDQTAPQAKDGLGGSNEWAPTWSMDIDEISGPSHFRHTTGTTWAGERSERSEREKGVGVSSDTTVSVSGESPAATTHSQDGLQLFSTHDHESGPAAAGDVHRALSASIQESTSLADPSVDSGGTIATAALLATAADQAPTDVTLLANQPFKENIAGAVVGTLSATDPDAGDTLTFSVSDPRFEVVGDQLKLKDGVRLDFERDPQVSLDVTATDSGGLSFTQTFAVSVGDVPEVRFAAFGDYGSRPDAQAVANLVDSLKVDFITTLGDNVYGTDPIDFQIGQLYSKYIGNYAGSYGPGSPENRFFPALGNHEYDDPAGGVNASAYFDYFTLPGNERYYDFTEGPIHFFVLNSEPEEPDGRSTTSVQAQWLQSGLANSTSTYNFVYFHRAPYSSNSTIGGYTTMQWPFEQWGATAVFSGHVHNYERILRDANGDGVVMPYFVSGMGAGGGDSFGTPVAGSAARYNADNGTLLVQVSAISCTFEFWSIAGGGTLIDSYTIDMFDPTKALFTASNDSINFNKVPAEGYLAGSQYDALAGDDTVTLAIDAKAASAAGYDPAHIFHGGDGNDQITGGTLNDAISGDAGNDTLSGGGGDDALDGGAGNDTVDYGAAGAGITANLGLGTGTGNGSDTLVSIENVSGSAFDDVLTGSTGANALIGAGGNDVIHGDDGNDTLTGGNGTDQLFGDAGHDTLKWDTVDSFSGGSGFDTLDADLASADTIDLRNSRFVGLERVLTGDGADSVTVRLSDVLAATADHQFVADLGNGADTLAIDLAGGWSATTANSTLGPTGVAAGISVVGMTAYTFTNGVDTVTIFSNAETVNQLSGSTPLFTINNDTVDFNNISPGSYLAGSQYDALAGNDAVTLPTDAAAASAAGYDPAKAFHGGNGVDTIVGGGLNDIIFGDLDADLLSGGAGNDTINGGGSGDTLSGGLGDDLLDGGSGTSIDKVDYSAAAGPVMVDLAAGKATGEGNDTILNVENVSGSAFDDAITGNATTNTLLGGAGNDVLHGGDGNDSLTGEAGLDQLFGDAGRDTLKWDGVDSYDGGDGFDTLDANVTTSDVIDLRGAGYVGLERILTGGGNDVVTLSLDQVLSDTADDQFVADLGGATDTLKIDISGGWTATTPNATLGPTGVAAGISIAGLTAYTFTKGGGTVTVFTNAEAVQQLNQSSPMLFSSGNDVVDFSKVAAGSYAAGSQYDALAGNDTVTMPVDAAAATAAGYSVGQAFTAGDGNDAVTGGGLNDVVNGGAGNDTLTGAAGDDSLSGGGDDDILTGGLGNDTIDGGAGNDTVNYSSAAAVVANLALGTATGDGTDTLVGIENAIGSGFDDTITGNAGANILNGGNGNDVIAGGDGNDTLTGDSSNDKLDGGAGNDNLNGGGSGDTLIGGLGDDTLDGGFNTDRVDYSAAAGPVTVDLAAGKATGEGNDTLLNLEDVIGSAFDDAITGDGNTNVLTGGAGNDVLHGGGGNDNLTGGTGIDQVFGDAGHDTLKWDSADSFDGGDGFDTLDANLSSADTIDLRGANFANLERVLTGSGKDTVTLSLSDVLSDTADHQFVADLGSSSPDTLNIDLTGGWTATTPNTTLGPTAVAAGISVSGMTALTFTNGADTVTIFHNAEVVNAQILS